MECITHVEIQTVEVSVVQQIIHDVHVFPIKWKLLTEFLSKSAIGTAIADCTHTYSIDQQMYAEREEEGRIEDLDVDLLEELVSDGDQCDNNNAQNQQGQDVGIRQLIGNQFAFCQGMG